MKRDLNLYIDDILESIALIRSYTKGVTETQFLTDRQVQDSVLRRLEVIGEAVKQLPTTIRDRYPDVPWRKISGFRDILAREYYGVQLPRIWKTMQRDLADLQAAIKKMRTMIHTNKE